MVDSEYKNRPGAETSHDTLDATDKSKMRAIKEVLNFLRNIPEALDQAKANTYGIYSMSSRERAKAAEHSEADVLVKQVYDALELWARTLDDSLQGVIRDAKTGNIISTSCGIPADFGLQPKIQEQRDLLRTAARMLMTAAERDKTVKKVVEEINVYKDDIQATLRSLKDGGNYSKAWQAKRIEQERGAEAVILDVLSVLAAVTNEPVQQTPNNAPIHQPT